MSSPVLASPKCNRGVLTVRLKGSSTSLTDKTDNSQGAEEVDVQKLYIETEQKQTACDSPIAPG